jgi:hypothetical protein
MDVIATRRAGLPSVPLASNAGSRQAPPEDRSAPRFRCHLNRFRRLNDDARPSASPDRTILERLPGPYLTRSTPRLLPERSPRQSSANAAPGRFDAYPRRTDAGEPAILHLSHSTAFQKTAPTSASFCVRDTQISRLSAWKDRTRARVLRPRRARRPLAITRPTVLPSTNRNVSAPQSMAFRGSIAGPRAPL